MLSTGKLTFLTPHEREALRIACGTDIHRNHKHRQYTRVIANGQLFHCKKYAKVTKRNNYTVLLTNGRLFEITTFISIPCHNTWTVYAIGNYLKVLQDEKINLPINHIFCVA